MSDKTKWQFQFFFGILFLFFSFERAQAQSSRSYAEMNITTNYIDRGLTQSEKGLAFNAGFGYMFGENARIGFEGANVKFEGEDTHIEARVLGEFKFQFTPNADLRLRNDLVRYFSETRRNKTVILLDQNFFDYHVLFSREDNFEGTKTPRDWFAFQKDWPVATSFALNTRLGYSMLQDYDSYFDLLAGASYSASATLTFKGGLTWTSKPDQFNGRGNLFYFLGLSGRF